MMLLIARSFARLRNSAVLYIALLFLKLERKKRACLHVHLHGPGDDRAVLLTGILGVLPWTRGAWRATWAATSLWGRAVEKVGLFWPYTMEFMV